MPVRLRPEERDRAEIADQRCVRLAELLPPALALDQDGPDADDGRAGRAQQAERRCARVGCIKTTRLPATRWRWRLSSSSFCGVPVVIEESASERERSPCRWIF